MDRELGQKIITSLTKFSDKKYAVTNTFGEVIAKSDNFNIEHNVLDTKSQRSLPLKFESKKMGHLYIDEKLTVIKELGSILKSMAELIIHQSYFTQILTSEEKKADQLIYDFLYNDEANLEELKRVFLSFGMDLSKNRLAIFLEIADENFLHLYDREIIEGERERKIARIKRGVKALLSSFYTHHRDNLIYYIGGGNFLILKDMGDNPEDYQEEFKKTMNSLFYNLKNELVTTITLGVGEFKPGLKGIKESFEEARTALRFGKQTWGTGKIFHFDSFGVVAPLFSGVTDGNVTFSHNIIHNLENYPELLSSLRYYFDYDLSLSKTSKKLKIHRNTLVYRLEKISEVTGFDPRVFNEAFQLQLALILDRYKDGN